MLMILLSGSLLLSAGCGQRTPNSTSAASKAFDGAPADVEQTWDKALTAEKSKDYVTAQAAFLSLEQMSLSDDQKKALVDERAGFGQNLTQAANDNDSAAIQALQMALKSRSR